MTFPTETEIKTVLRRGMSWAAWTGADWLAQEMGSVLHRMNGDKGNGKSELVCEIDWNAPQEGCST